MKKIILPAILSLLVLIIILPGYLIPAKITCKNQYNECPYEVVSKIAYLNNKKIGYAKRHLEKELSSNFLVSAYTIQFKLPNILEIDLVVKKSIFALKDRISGYYALVDSEGTVLAISESTQLPVVMVNGNLPDVGSKVCDSYFLALNLLNGVNKMYQINTGTIEADTLLVDLPGGIRVIFPLAEADRDLLLGSLRLIYSNIQNTDGKQAYSQIDLRYENPVLR